MTARAQSLPIRRVITQVWPQANWDHMVSVGLSFSAQNARAMTANVGIAEKHGLPPCSMLRVTVATPIAVGPVLDPANLRFAPGRSHHLNPLRHHITAASIHAPVDSSSVQPSPGQGGTNASRSARYVYPIPA